MIARHNGRVVLVTGAISGERVLAVVDHERRDVVMAKVTEVVDPHPDRRQPAGDPSCGGLAYAHITYERQRALKGEIVADGLRRLARTAWTARIPVAPSPEAGYRMRARLHVRNGRVGFLREGTHTLCDAAETGQLSGDCGLVLREVGERLAAAWPVVVSELALSENLTGDQRALHLTASHVESARLAPLGCCAGVTGISVARPGGHKAHVVAGRPTVIDPVGAIVRVSGALAETPLTRQAASFFQANRFLLSQLVTRVCAQVSHEPVLDLYSGVGLFSVALAVLGRTSITAVERDDFAAADLVVNTATLQDHVRPVHASVESYLEDVRGKAAATVIVDPPRAGLSRTVIERLAALAVRRIVYVSCDVATFARDVGRLRTAGYGVRHLEAFDFFPNTAHVEVLAALERSTSAAGPRTPSGPEPASTDGGSS